MHAIWLWCFGHLIDMAIPSAVAALGTIHAVNLHTKHARLNEAGDIIGNEALRLVQKYATADVLKHVAEMVEAKSSAAAIGAYLSAAFGRPLLAELLGDAAGLVEQELPILFGGQAKVEAAALKRLGLAGAQVAGTAKVITTLADGAKVVRTA